MAGARDDDQGWGLIQPYEALTASFDPRRPGPAAPNTQVEKAPGSQDTDVRPLAVHADPLTAARNQAVWWVLGAGGLAALALLLRPLARSRQEVRDE